MITTKGLLVPSMQLAKCYSDAGCPGSAGFGGKKGAAWVASFPFFGDFAITGEPLGLDDPYLEGAGAVAGAAVICHAGLSSPTTVQELS